MNQTLLTTILLLGIYSISLTIQQRSKLSFTFANHKVSELSRAIANHANGGRVLIAGFTLHELVGGHVAPLPFFSNTPLIARSYKHDSWNYLDVIPEEYRRNKGERIEEFFDLYNISAIVTHDRFWRKYFKQKTNEYELLWNIEGFAIFGRKKSPPGYFAEGSGEVIEQKPGELVLRLDSQEAVLRFHYFPFLEASHCQLSSKELQLGVPFLKLGNCQPGTTVRVRAEAPWKRFQ